MSKRPGRKPSFVTFAGKTVDGLLYDKTNRSHYTNYTDEETGKRKKKNLGRDVITAIDNLRRFQGQFANRKIIHEKESIVNLIDNNANPYVVKREIKNYLTRVFRLKKQLAMSAFSEYIPDEYKGFAWYKIKDYIFEEYPDKIEELYQVLQDYAKDKKVKLDVFQEIDVPEVNYIMPEDVFWSRVRREIIDNPYFVSQKTGIEEIAYLRTLPKSNKPIRLDDIIDMYVNRTAKKLSPKAKRDSKRWWSEFKDIISKDNIRLITQDDINKYHDKIHDIADINNYSPSFISHRFSTIKTILNYALKKSNDKSDIREVLDYCRSFSYPNKKASHPQPISRNDFHKILTIADERWKAILLTALNFGLYAKDISDIKKTDIDLHTKEMRMIRQKTNILRVGCLWNRTAEAIKKYQKAYPSGSEYLFVSNHKGQYCTHSIRNYFRRLKRNAKVSEDVKFEHLRDAAQSIPAHNGCPLDNIRFLLGHKVAGVTDDYLQRLPKMTKDVCKAIEKHFF